MIKTKTRIQGRSVVVTLPAQSGITIEANKEYIVSYEQDGSILLVPKIENPFAVAEENAYYEEDIWEKMPSVGKERLTTDE
jgi:hypothetical protein